MVTSIQVYKDKHGSYFPSVSICNNNPFSTDIGFNFMIRNVNESLEELGLAHIDPLDEFFVSLLKFTALSAALNTNGTFNQKFWNPIEDVIVS